MGERVGQPAGQRIGRLDFEHGMRLAAEQIGRRGGRALVSGQDRTAEADLLVDREPEPGSGEGAPPVPGGHLRHQAAVQHGGRFLAAQQGAHLATGEPGRLLDLEPDAGRQERRGSFRRRRGVLAQADPQAGAGARGVQIALVRRVEIGGARPGQRPRRVVDHLRQAPADRGQEAAEAVGVEEEPVLELGRHAGQSTMRPNAARHISSSVCSPSSTSTGSSRPCSLSARLTYGLSIVLS